MMKSVFYLIFDRVSLNPGDRSKTLLYNFSSKYVSGGSQKKHARTAFSKYLESKCLYIHVNLYKMFFPNM